MSVVPDTVLVHAVWTLASDAPPLTDATMERFAPYATRWAKTLGVMVWAVGGTGDTLHLLFDAPVDRAVQSVTSELQSATARFAKDTLGLNNFAWRSVSYEGVGAHEKEARIGYIHTIARRSADDAPRPEGETKPAASTGETRVEADAMPDWLREALAASKARV